jgi:hypothetical protein
MNIPSDRYKKRLRELMETYNIGQPQKTFQQNFWKFSGEKRRRPWRDSDSSIY